jgi:type III secretion protein R
MVKLIFVLPAFMISELTRAFQIGFLLYLPFIVLDLIVANILLSLGMSSLSPVTISLPIKLLLFVGLEGWRRLFEALVLSYA